MKAIVKRKLHCFLQQLGAVRVETLAFFHRLNGQVLVEALFNAKYEFPGIRFACRGFGKRNSILSGKGVKEAWYFCFPFL